MTEEPFSFKTGHKKRYYERMQGCNDLNSDGNCEHYTQRRWGWGWRDDPSAGGAWDRLDASCFFKTGELSAVKGNKNEI
jgi:hypothetical protein